MVSQKIRKLLTELADTKCEMCEKVFKWNELCIHRVRRGNQGGTYHWRNCMVLCSDCHKKIHGNEWSNCKGK